MQGHDVIRLLCCSDISDPRPLRVPSMRPVIRVGRLRKTIERPSTLRPDTQQCGAMVPSGRPDRIGSRIRIAIDTARTGDLHKLVATHHLPGLPIPFAKRSCLDGRIDPRTGAGLTIVRIHIHTLSRIKSFAMHTGQERTFMGLRAFLSHLIAILEKHLHLQGMHIHLIEAFFHRGIEDLVRRIRQAPGHARQPPRHPVRLDGPNTPLIIDHMISDEELTGFLVDHPVGMRTTNRLCPHDPRQVISDLIQFI